jgi:geranylgeranylglycerol-phosphate geranylgeranyltransferase
MPAASPAATEESPLAILFHISRFHIICIASVTSLTFGWLLTGRYVFLAPLVCALDWFLVNLMNRIADLVEDRINGVTGTAFVDRHARALTVASTVLLVGSFPALHLLAPALTIPRVAFQLIGLAYNYKVLPGRSGLTRFKETYFLKNTSSTVLFILSTLVYPAALAGWNVSLTRALWLAAFFFPLELTYEIIYDLRDVAGDRQEKVPTFPVVHGERASRRIVEALLVASGTAVVAGYLVGGLRFRELVLVGGVIQQAIYFEKKFASGFVQADCVFLTYLGAAQVASYDVWVALGLPLGAG